MTWMRGLGAALLGLAIPHVARADLEPAKSHPPDPFAHDYKIPEERESGAAAGQFRIIGSGLVAVGREGWELGLHGTLELMTYAYLSIRGSLQANALVPLSEPTALSAKVGPSLHLLPYHPFDITLFVEGGAAAIDLFGHGATAMPVIAPGGTFEVWLGSSAFLRAEGHLDWGIYEAGGTPRSYLRLAFAAGLGFAL